MTDPKPLTPEQLDATTDDLTPEELALADAAAAIVDHVEPAQPRERTLHAADTLNGAEPGLEGVRILRPSTDANGVELPLRIVCDFEPTEPQRASISARMSDGASSVIASRTLLEWQPDGRTAFVRTIADELTGTPTREQTTDDASS